MDKETDRLVHTRMDNRHTDTQIKTHADSLLYRQEDEHINSMANKLKDVQNRQTIIMPFLSDFTFSIL